MHFLTYALVPPPSVRLVLFSFKSNYLVYNPTESERSPQISRKACKNVLCVLRGAVLGLLILTFSAVQYGLHERLRVQPAQANEVRRSVHAQGLYHRLKATYANTRLIVLFIAEVFKVLLIFNPRRR
jgi:hypothetical protein